MKIEAGMPRINALTIAGTDPSGGAGIQADLKAFSALGAYGCSVVTALVAQNTRGVQSVYRVAPEFVAAQLDSVFSDVRIDTTKIGMHVDDIAHLILFAFLHVIFPAAGVSTGALIGVAFINIARKQAATGIGHTQRAVHKHFDFHFRHLLADLGNFLQR